jgi:hypothetical protein
MVSTTFEQSSEHVWNSLLEWFEKYGKPETIHCDNGGPFTSEGKHTVLLSSRDFMLKQHYV